MGPNQAKTGGALSPEGRRWASKGDDILSAHSTERRAMRLCDNSSIVVDITAGAKSKDAAKAEREPLRCDESI